MFASSNPQGPVNGWRLGAKIVLRVGLLGAAVYLAATYYQRWTRPRLERHLPKREIHLDYYTFLPKSYVTDFELAKKLIGKPLWVKEGYRWIYEPGDNALGPLEKIVPTGVRRRGNEVQLEFDKDGQRYTIPIGSEGRRFYVDELFLLKDPREIWDHWTEETWSLIRDHQVHVGMSEYQVTFALGAGNAVRASPRSLTRIVDYRLGEDQGIEPVRVTFRNGVVERIDKLQE